MLQKLNHNFFRSQSTDFGKDTICCTIERALSLVDIYRTLEIRYFGVVIISGAKFKCSIDKAKRSFYRAANGIFAKIGRLASQEVMVQLLKQKCWPILLYALDGNCELLSKTVRL